jgi:hypothetical protein
MNPVAVIDPTTATFVLAILILVAGVVLAMAALKAPAGDSTAQQAFAAVGVLFGLLAAGGLGGLFAGSVAQDAAEAGADQAVESATEEVTAQTKKVTKQVGELSKQVEGLEPTDGTAPGGANGK